MKLLPLLLVFMLIFSLSIVAADYNESYAEDDYEIVDESESDYEYNDDDETDEVETHEEETSFVAQITQEAAVVIALEIFPGETLVEVSEEHDDGISYYEIELSNDIEVAVDAQTGDVIEYESPTVEYENPVYEEEIEVEIDEEDIAYFVDTLGSEIRKLQLVARLVEHVYLGNEVITYIEDEEIAREAEALLEEMSQLTESLEAETEITAASFVSYKADATSLTKDFRELVRSHIDADERELIMQAMQEVKKNDLVVIREEIKERIQERNLEHLEQLTTRLELETDLAEQVRAGELSLREAVAELREMHKEARAEAREALQAERVAAREAVREAAENRREAIEAEIQARQQLREQRIEEIQAREQLSRANAVARIHQVNDRYRGRTNE